ncbi:hypothetical protein BDF14DRAFT_1780835 [Spinellus fusiger]|nr:hypothetical protein BDF14DRAFT_1780835 [Spinellus fusiger]
MKKHASYSSSLFRNSTVQVVGEDALALETSTLQIQLPDSSQESGLFPSKKIKHNHHQWEVDLFYCSPSNPLATADMESIFNSSMFHLLPPKKRDELAQLLPAADIIVTQPSHSPLRDIPASFFSRTENPMFWHHLEAWQMHLSGEPTSENNTIPGEITYDTFKEGTVDSGWDLQDKDTPVNVAGDSKSITLKDMCRKGLIRENDILVYKRNFSACKVIVTKSIKVVRATGFTGISIELDGQRFDDFETPTALETKILDHHGQVKKDKRPNGNAFKSIRLLRNNKDLGRLFDIRKDGFGDSG